MGHTEPWRWAVPPLCLHKAPTWPICGSICLGDCVCVCVVPRLHDMSTCACLGSPCRPGLPPACGHRCAGLAAVIHGPPFPHLERWSKVSACISATRAPTLQSLPCLCTQGGDPRTCLSACTSLVLVRGDTRGGAVSPYIGRAHVWLHMRVCLCHGFTVFSCAGLDALPSFRSLLRSPCTFTHTLLFAFSLPFLRGPCHRAPPSQQSLPESSPVPRTHCPSLPPTKEPTYPFSAFCSSSSVKTKPPKSSDMEPRISSLERLRPHTGGTNCLPSPSPAEDVCSSEASASRGAVASVSP